MNLQSGIINVSYTFFEKKWTSSEWQSRISQIPEKLRARVCRYHRWQDRQAGLLGKLLVGKSLIHGGIGCGALRDVTYDRYGRPYINRDIDFNVSHSGRYVVCASAVRCRVGIDIEKVRLLDLSDFRNEFSLKEQAVIEKANDPLRSFYEHWTAKEAVIKADGRGMQIPLKDVRIDSTRAYLYDKIYWLKRVELNDVYCCRVALDREIHGVHIYDAGTELFVSGSKYILPEKQPGC